MACRSLERIACLVCCVFAGVSPAEEPRWTTTIVGEREGAATAGRLQAVRELEAKKQWPDAVEEYLAILAGAGDELVPVSGGHLIQARRRCHQRLALMPAEALALYRKRADAQAKKWYEAGAAERDPRQLRRVVDEAFCSRPAEAALDLLGELAFEQGKMDEAEHWWRMLARPASEASQEYKPTDLDLVYPDPQGDVARYRAKQLLARLFRGDPSFAPELKAFRALHPKAEGWLAGRKGNFGEILQSMSEQSDWKAPPRPATAWATFAGDGTRNRVLPAPPDRNWLSRLCDEEPARFDLAKHAFVKPEPASTPLLRSKIVAASESAQCLAFLPVLVDHKVVVADTKGVTLYDPLTGAVHDWTLEHGVQEAERRQTKLPAPPDLRYTLTAVGSRIYARLGAPALDAARKEQEQSYIVCLEWDAHANQLQERWHISSALLGKAQFVFEGSPLVDGDRAFAAFTRLDDRAGTGIVCLDVGTGAVRWRQEVCESTPDPKQPRYRHNLLSLAGTQLIYCTHSGVIEALDSATGKRLWAVHYPSSTDLSPRDLTPCLVDGSRLFAAPADCKKLFCLDAATGLLMWKRNNIDVVHLLGVADGLLIFNTSKSIRAIRASSGLDEWSAPAIAETPFTYGRGLICGDLVLYPTVDGVKVLDVRDGQPTERLNVPNGRLGAVHGHLAYADGILAVTDRTQLTVFVAPALRREQRKQDVRAKPESALAHYRLAMAETDAGNVEEAIKEWQHVETMATPDDRWHRRALRERAQELRHELLLRAAQEKQALRKWEEAEVYLDHAAEEQFPNELRVRALVEKADLWAAANEPAREADVWRAMAFDKSLSARRFLDKAGNPQVPRALVPVRVTHAKSPRTIVYNVEPAKPNAPPESQLLWRRDGDILLGSGERLLSIETSSGSSPDRLFSARDRTLICRDTGTGKELWTQPLLWKPSWIGQGDRILAGGTNGLEARWSGARQWAYPAPPFDAFQTRSDTAPPLSDFHLSGDSLYFVQGGSRFFAMDAKTGLILWTRWAPDARLGLPYPAGHFFPRFQADAKRVALQTYAGKWWLLDAADGRLIHCGETNRKPWAQAPVIVDSTHWCIATDPQRVLMFDPETGKELWAYEVPGKTTSSGEMPLVLTDGHNLVVPLARNYGFALQRLDQATGKAMWDRERIVSTDRLALDAIALDQAAIYVATHNMLSAYALRDGRLLWDRPFDGPEGNRRVALYGEQLVVYPAEARAAEFQVRTPFGALEWIVAAFAGYPRRQEYPVIFADPKTGRLDQRLNFTVPATRCRVRIDANAAGLEACVRLASPPSPTCVSFDGAAATVVVPDRLWHLTGGK